MIKFAILGSGSKGNAVYFNVDGHQFLVDCGFTKKETAKRMAMIGREIKDIERVFVTHDHGDHCAPWVVKEGLTESGRFNGKDGPFYEFCKIKAFPLSHDSRDGDSWGYTITDKDGNKVAVVMDTGCIPEEILPNLFDCAAILIECNYDVDMLVKSPYGIDLLERIASPIGHLRNECAAEVVEMVNWPGLQFVVAMHLSKNNNNPVMARFCLESTGTKAEVVISSQKEASKLMVVI